MHRLMAASDPTGAIHKTGAMIFSTSHDDGTAGNGGSFHMALVAQGCITSDEHFGVNGAVRIVACHTAFADRLMLEYKRTLLSSMTGGACLTLTSQTGTLAQNCIATMRIMTSTAAHLAREHGMGMRQTELAALFHMTLKACFR